MYKKILSFILSLVLCVGLLPFSVLASDDIVILYTNDIHTYIDKDITYSKIASLKKSYGDNVLLLDAGDHLQGTAYGSMDKGNTIIELMNKTGYDAATLGNHEFDYGMSGCMDAIQWADFPYLSCDFYKIEDNSYKNVLDSYKIFEVNNKKIAVIGISTPETMSSTTPSYFQDENGNYIYGFYGGNDGKELYQSVQKSIDEASREADYIIALGHLGDDIHSSPWCSEDVIENTSGLDAFIDGHSHSTVEMKEIDDKDGNTVVLTQTGEYFNAVGKMVISDNGITSHLLTSSDLETVTPDDTVAQMEKDWLNEIDNKLGEKIGSTEVILDNYDESHNRLVRSEETNSGDFSADALYYLFDNMDMDVDVAVMNGGGIRNTAISGDITYKTCKDIHTFGNVACLLNVTGQQILDALEWGARVAGTSEEGSFLHVSGLTYQIDTSILCTVQYDDNVIWTSGPTGEYRVHNVKIYNKDSKSWDNLDLDAHYNLAGYNYTLRDLGGGFAMFDGAVNVLDYVMEDYMVLANYVKGFEDSIVKADNSPLAKKYKGFTVDYGTVNGSGRIIRNSKEKVYSINLNQGKGGTVELSSSTYKYGDIIKIKVLPDEGKTLDNISIIDQDGRKIEFILDDGLYCFTCSDSQITIDVMFKDIVIKDVVETSDNESIELWIFIMCLSSMIFINIYSKEKATL